MHIQVAAWCQGQSTGFICEIWPVYVFQVLAIIVASLGLELQDKPCAFVSYSPIGRIMLPALPPEVQRGMVVVEVTVCCLV
jgi:hypothetical protein